MAGQPKFTDTILNGSLMFEDLSQGLEEKVDEKLPVILKSKMCQVGIPSQRWRDLCFFSKLYRFKSQSHFHWMTNLLRMHLEEEVEENFQI